MKNSSKKGVVLAAITMLYACNIVESAIEWYQEELQFVNNGDIRDSIFLSLYEICTIYSKVSASLAH